MIPKKTKSGFEKYFESRMKDADFAAEYVKARREIDATDKLVRALDQVRVAKGLTKADLARQISAKPEIVRRLFTSRSPNPTISSVISIANALGFHLALVPNRGGSMSKRVTRTVRHRVTERGHRARNSRPSSLTSS